MYIHAMNTLVMNALYEWDIPRVHVLHNLPCICGTYPTLFSHTIHIRMSTTLVRG